MTFKEKSKKEKVKFVLLIGLVLVCVLIASLSGQLFPGSTFAAIIDNSIGKFFNLWAFIKNSYIIVLESVAILFFVWLLNKGLLLLLSMFTKNKNRTHTLGILFSSSIKYLSFLIAIFLILSAWGVEKPTLLAGAGILGLALSFGAQSMIEDIFAGLSIMFEKQFTIGDIIQVNSFRGVVKEIGLRITKIEDLNGDMLLINNSDIRNAINTSCALSVAICDISLEYGADLEKIEKVIEKELVNIKKNIPLIIEGPFYYGVEQLADSSLVIRVTAKTEEKNKNSVRRALNREMKLLFDKHQINIPFPQLVLHQYQDPSKK